jgi:hypothetical protein
VVGAEGRPEDGESLAVATVRVLELASCGVEGGGIVRQGSDLRVTVTQDVLGDRHRPLEGVLSTGLVNGSKIVQVDRDLVRVRPES